MFSNRCTDSSQKFRCKANTFSVIGFDCAVGFIWNRNWFIFFFFFLNDTAPPEISPLSLPDALPIGDEPLFGLGVDVRDDLDVRLQSRAEQLRLQQAVDLVDAARVVHRDRDPDRTFLAVGDLDLLDRKSTRLNSSHSQISYAVFCLKK